MVSHGGSDVSSVLERFVKAEWWGCLMVDWCRESTDTLLQGCCQCEPVLFTRTTIGVWFCRWQDAVKLEGRTCLAHNLVQCGPAVTHSNRRCRLRLVIFNGSSLCNIWQAGRFCYKRLKGRLCTLRLSLLAVLLNNFFTFGLFLAQRRFDKL